MFASRSLSLRVVCMSVASMQGCRMAQTANCVGALPVLATAVVAPKTLLTQWTKELKICGLGGATSEYGGSAGER